MFKIIPKKNFKPPVSRISIRGKKTIRNSALSQIKMYFKRNLTREECAVKSKTFLANKSPKEREFILRLWASFREKERTRKSMEEKLQIVFDAQRQWEDIYVKKPNQKKMMLATRTFFVKNGRLPTITELIRLTKLSRNQISALIKVLYTKEFIKPKRASSTGRRKTKHIPKYDNEK